MEEMTGRLEDKKEQTKREITGEEDSLAGILPKDCLVGQIGNMMNSIGRD